MTETSVDVQVLGAADEVGEGTVVPYYLGDRKCRISVARVDGLLHAFDDLCTHGPCPLSSGLLDGATLRCQCHGCGFDVRTGQVLSGPATRPLAVYEVRDSDGLIKVSISAGAVT